MESSLCLSHNQSSRGFINSGKDMEVLRSYNRPLNGIETIIANAAKKTWRKETLLLIPNHPNATIPVFFSKI